DAVEGYMTEDAEYLLIMTNSFSTLGKAAVKRARERGIKAGLLRLRLIRPFPDDDIRKALRGRKGVAVIDQNISVGKGGILYSEIASAVYNSPFSKGGMGGFSRPLLLSFIGGLGGKNISPVEFEFIFDSMEKAVKTGKIPETHLLYTEAEMKEMERLKKIAGKC
ncbi:MAG: pyruvate synthase, partial [Deltaproteobacteria bacterium]|nr:pyruvate synthase [Deltaproteobacteria bacterium]